MNPTRRLRPVRSSSPASAPREDLLFCAVCQVSIARAEVESGEARRTPKGRLFCGVCATSSPAERDQRRAELEIEFADDAPVAVAAARSAPAPSVNGVRTDAPPPLPAPSMSDDPVIEARVGELERSAFRMQARIRQLEEKLDAVLRRLG